MTSVLAFDTSGPWCSVAIANDSRIIAHASHYLPRAHSKELFPLILNLLKEANLSLSDIDRLATITGPGSFTGLRVGLAAAQGISFALEKPLIGIDAFKAYAHALDAPDNRLVVLDTQKEDLYCQLLDQDLTPLKEAVALHPNQIAEYAGDQLFNLIGDGAEKATPYLNELDKPFEFHKITADEVCQSSAMLAVLASDDNKVAVEPFYIHPAKITKPRS